MFLGQPLWERKLNFCSRPLVTLASARHYVGDDQDGVNDLKLEPDGGEERCNYDNIEADDEWDREHILVGAHRDVRRSPQVDSKATGEKRAAGPKRIHRTQ